MLKGILASHGRNAIGRLGEHLAYLLLEQCGYRCSFTRQGQQRGDLRVVDPASGVIHRVEVKTARRASDHKWRFLLWKKGHQDYRHADFVLLLAVWISGEVTPFVIPVADLGERSQICISSHPLHYTGCWATYRQTPSSLSLTGDQVNDKPIQAIPPTARSANAASSPKTTNAAIPAGSRASAAPASLPVTDQPGDAQRTRRPSVRPAQPNQAANPGRVAGQDAARAAGAVRLEDRQA